MGLSQTPQALVPAAFSSIPANAGATVSANESTNSTGYTNLTTVGPAVTVTTGTAALVIVSFLSSEFSYSGQNMSFAISGATTLAANDANAASLTVNSAADMNYSKASYVTLTAGSNTFTAKYRCPGNSTRGFANRQIFVINLG